jgi:hypothetical protein
VFVIATRTSQPDFCKSRKTSIALYAAIPPQTPKPTRIFYFPSYKNEKQITTRRHADENPREI